VFSHASASPSSFASPSSSAGPFASPTSAVFASSPSSAGGNYYAGVGAYDEMSPPPSSASAYSDSTSGDAAFPPTQTQHYPLDMALASAYVPHLLQQASLLMHPHAYELQEQSQGNAPALLHGLSPLHVPPGMQGPPLQLQAHPGN
jgi:hypothetical protein